jgi:hypothetical protein
MRVLPAPSVAASVAFLCPVLQLRVRVQLDVDRDPPSIDCLQFGVYNADRID